MNKENTITVAEPQNSRIKEYLKKYRVVLLILVGVLLLGSIVLIIYFKKKKKRISITKKSATILLPFKPLQIPNNVDTVKLKEVYDFISKKLAFFDVEKQKDLDAYNINNLPVSYLASNRKSVLLLFDSNGMKTVIKYVVKANYNFDEKKEVLCSRLFGNTEHENLIEIYDVETRKLLHSTVIIILMRYCEVDPWNMNWKHENEIREYATQVLLGMKVLHDNKWAHLDFKLCNTVAVKNGKGDYTYKIIDYGNARCIESGTSEKYTAGRGTPGYTDYEGRVKGIYGYASDIWAIGRTLLNHNTVENYRDMKDSFENVDENYEFNKYVKFNNKYSLEMKHFIWLCLQKNFDDRPNVKTLLNHEFIRKKTIQNRKAIEQLFKQ